jgi:amidase
MVPAAHATDGLGSIRIPASSCGLVGLKPTHGLVPLGPDPDHWNGLSHAGVLTRTVADTAVLLDVLTGGEALPPDDRDGASGAGEPARPLRVAVSGRPSTPVRVDPRVRQVLADTAETLRALGHTVVDRDPPYGQRLSTATTLRYTAGAAADLAALAQPDRVERSTAAVARLGRRTPRRGVRWARREADRFAARMGAMFDDVDVLVTPTVARLPVRAGSLTGRSFGAVVRAMLPYAAFTGPWNACGFPALSVPAGWTPEGLPVGVQLVGPPGADRDLLGLAGALEAALGWPGRRPVLG